MYYGKIRDKFIWKKMWQLLSLALFFPTIIMAQQNAKDSTIEDATLAACVHYAITHNPDLTNAKLDENITEAAIQIKLSEW